MIWLRLWWLHLLAVAAVVGCAAGGLWQLGVYESRQHAGSAPSTAVVPLTDVWSPATRLPADDVGRHVRVSGDYAGKPFDVNEWVAVPVRVAGTDHALIVVLGQGPARLTPMAGPVELTVALQPRDAKINVPRLANDLAVDLYNGYGIAVSDTGLTPVPVPDGSVSWSVGARNLAYALQWWVFGGFAVFMWWRICNDHVRRPTEDE